MASEYLFPTTVDDALDLLDARCGEARVIAGGTDLMIQVKEGERIIETFVDITRIPDIAGIRELDDGHIWVGATTTHHEIWESPLIQAHATVLAQACRAVGALQVQSVGTLGGNVVNAMPAADGSIALMALSAQAEIATKAGRQWVNLEDVFMRPGVCKIESCAEVLTGFRFKKTGAGAGSAFERLARRRALSLPVLNCGAVVRLNAAGTHFESATIALGPVAPLPFRPREAEAMLAGAPANEETIAAAAAHAMEESHPRTSLTRASREYRLEMVTVLTRRALTEAMAQARQ